MVTPAEKTSDFIHIVEKFDHLEHLKLITFLMESSHLATNRATAFFRDAIPLQQTKHYTTETKMQNFFKSSQTTNQLFFQITHINREQWLNLSLGSCQKWTGSTHFFSFGNENTLFNGTAEISVKSLYK